jgi:hypothetical protein
MKFVIEFDADRKLNRGTFHGPINDQLMLAWYDRCKQVVHKYKTQAAIVDFSDVTSFDVSPATMRHLASMAPILSDPHPRCIVAPSDFLYGMMRMFQMLSRHGRHELHILRTMTEAYQVLGLKLEPAFEIYETVEFPAPGHKAARKATAK